METLQQQTISQNNSIEESDNLKMDEFGYSIEISPTLYNQITKNIKQLKKADIRHSLQSWTLEAFREKMIIEKHNKGALPKAKILSFKISQKTRDYVLERVQKLREICKSYSMKKWMVEALIEKLEREQAKD